MNATLINEINNFKYISYKTINEHTIKQQKI